MADDVLTKLAKRAMATVLDRIEAIAQAYACSQILDQLILEEIAAIREEYDVG